uniref:Uncharacterized protein n=1 Tax=Rhizophora mucronata TaxID=61149 RepID=A0A2P2N354_RHIMU
MTLVYVPLILSFLSLDKKFKAHKDESIKMPRT